MDYPTYIADVNQYLASRIDAMALAHYTRDIRGELALRDWQRLAESLREAAETAMKCSHG